MPDLPRASHDEPSTGEVLGPRIESCELDLADEDFYAGIGGLTHVWETEHPPKPPGGMRW